MSSPPVRESHRPLIGWLCALLGVMASLPQPAAAHPVPVLAVQAPESSSDVAEETEITEEDRERRKQMLSVSWIMLIGIALLCGLTLLIVIYLGSRARRIARTSRPQTPLKNEFWYLKKESAPESDPDKDEPA